MMTSESQVYLGQTSSKRLLFRTWFNTAFVSPGSYSLTSDELDKVFPPLNTHAKILTPQNFLLW
jgi:hypothetical protein